MTLVVATIDPFAPESVAEPDEPDHWVPIHLLSVGDLPPVSRQRKPKPVLVFKEDHKGWLWSHPREGGPWTLVYVPEGALNPIAFAHRNLALGKWTMNPATGAIRNARTSKRVTQRENSSGYLRVGVYVPGVGMRQVLTHRLIQEHLRGPMPDGFEVDHTNGNKLDNRPINLRAVTPAENRQAAVERRVRRVERLDQETVLRIRRLGKSRSVRDVARLVGLPVRRVGPVISGRTYRHVTA